MRVPDDGVRRAVELMNGVRRGAGDSAGDRLEEAMTALFGATGKLVVYGTLQPGAENHHVLSSLAGRWRDCRVRGTRHDEGWGAVRGYPAIRLDERAPAVAAKLFESSELASFWPELDRFEGAGYQRVLVTAYDAQGEAIAVANIYEARGGGR